MMSCNSLCVLHQGSRNSLSPRTAMYQKLCYVSPMRLVIRLSKDYLNRTYYSAILILRH